MKKTLDQHTDASDLRKRAKSRLAENRKSQQVGTEEGKTNDEPQRLIQELQIHQIELEIQNEELSRTRQEAEIERERYADLYDFAPVGYFSLDSGGIIRQANLAGAGLLGVERSRLINVRFMQFVSDADRPIFDAFLNNVFTNRIKDACDLSLKKEGRHQSYVQIEANVTEDGRECRIAVLDISERRKAEEELQRAELHYRLLHETILQGVIYQDVEGRIVSMNPAAVRILGKDPEECLGHASESIEYPSLREDGSLLQESDHPSMVALRTGKELRDLVMGVYNPREKDYRWLNVRAMPLFRSGEDQPHQVYIIFDDITESRRIEKILKDSEVLYRRLFETAQDGILILDAETGQISDVNPSLVEMLGYSHEDFSGKKLWEIGVFKNLAASKASFSELQEKGYVRYSDLPLETKDGRPMAVEFVGNVYQCNHYKVIQCNIRDITARKHIAEALQKAHEELERRVEDRTAELRTALSEIKSMKDKLEAENVYFREEIKSKHKFSSILGQSDGLKYVLYRAEQVASTNTTVLILGETGTGKELIAFAIHGMSSRKDRPLITVNCAALPGNLIESELFGREKGAFTGADARQVGRFEIADGSTLCLDEIGELPLELQAKLLRVIQHNEFERLGSSRTIKVDVRIIATTNRDLEEEIRKGRFRQDLYYRLNVFPLTLPPLRQRKDDIPLMVRAFMERYSRKMGKQIKSIHKETMNALQEYSWPGNVRELESIIERAVILCRGPVLQLDDKLEISPTLFSSAVRTLEETERNQILKILSETRWRIEGEEGAAAVLGLNPSTLRARMHKLGVVRPETRKSGS